MLLWLSHPWLPQQPSNALPGSTSGRTIQAARGTRTKVAPELEGGEVKAGWWVHRRDPADRGLQWSYLPPCFPLTSRLFLEEVNIWCQAQDTEQKSHNHFQ